MTLVSSLWVPFSRDNCSCHTKEYTWEARRAKLPSLPGVHYFPPRLSEFKITVACMGNAPADADHMFL